MPGFDEAYPAVREWVTSHGWIEVGVIDGFNSMIQVLNEGGLIWEGEASYPSLDAAFQAADERSPDGWRRSTAADSRSFSSGDGTVPEERYLFA